jgi:amino acid permease
LTSISPPLSLLPSGSCGLAYYVCASGALTVFKYFVSVISMLGAITWTVFISLYR